MQIVRLKNIADINDVKELWPTCKRQTSKILEGTMKGDSNIFKLGENLIPTIPKEKDKIPAGKLANCHDHLFSRKENTNGYQTWKHTISLNQRTCIKISVRNSYARSRLAKTKMLANTKCWQDCVMRHFILCRLENKFWQLF